MTPMQQTGAEGAKPAGAQGTPTGTLRGAEAPSNGPGIRTQVEIRPLHTLEECQKLEGLQQKIWGFSALDTLPAVQFYNTAKYGGQVLGGFDPAGEMVVFSYAFLARDGASGRIYLHSDLMGVSPELQSAGIGQEIKLAQRTFALAAGIDLIRWTYDPMETRNGNLNLRKLGGEVRELVKNLYGAVDNALSADLPTHRFMVDWELRRAPGAADNGFAGAPVVLTTTGTPSADAAALSSGASHLILPAPLDFQRLKTADLELARRWQTVFCDSAQYLFARGYAAVNFRRNDDTGMGEYLLRGRTA